jgi:hypothetical protein
MSAVDAAEYIGISESLLRELNIPVIRIGDRRKIYLIEDLDAYLDRLAGRTQAESDQAATPWSSFEP